MVFQAWEDFERIVCFLLRAVQDEGGRREWIVFRPLSPPFAAEQALARAGSWAEHAMWCLELWCSHTI